MKKAILALMIVLLLSQSAMSLAYALGPPVAEQAIFIHYAHAAAKPTPPVKDSGSYKVFAHWLLDDQPVTYTINPSVSDMTPTDVVRIVQIAAEEWDDGECSGWLGVSRNLFEYVGASEKTYDDLAWTSGDLDGENTLVFGDYTEANVIAVTLIWYTRVTKQILEFDMVFDTTWKWGDADEESRQVMDLQNIATHELGHAVGLGDLYRPNTALETMYGYASYDETIKRDLYNGDKAGIISLYG